MSRVQSSYPDSREFGGSPFRVLSSDGESGPDAAGSTVNQWRIVSRHATWTQWDWMSAVQNPGRITYENQHR